MNVRNFLRRISPARMPRPMLNIARGVLLAIVMMFLGAAVFVLWGAYNVSALQQHTAPVYRVISIALRRSIERHAKGIETPSLSEPRRIEEGFRHYRHACLQCHGAPGVGRHDIGKAMMPVPANMVEAARQRTPAEIFWTAKHGIKMSGMPAWEFVYSDDELWSIVAFVMTLPELSPADYRAMDARLPPEDAALSSPAWSTPDPERGRVALQGYACTACHSIPGVIGPEPDIGPPLQGIAERRYVAGVLTNDFDNMVRWIHDPVAVDPLTAMPDLNVKQQDAADIAAYLYTMEEPSGE